MICFKKDLILSLSYSKDEVGYLFEANFGGFGPLAKLSILQMLSILLKKSTPFNCEFYIPSLICDHRLPISRGFVLGTCLLDKVQFTKRFYTIALIFSNRMLMKVKEYRSNLRPFLIFVFLFRLIKYDLNLDWFMQKKRGVVFFLYVYYFYIKVSASVLIEY